jgi:hypothetical protein
MMARAWKGTLTVETRQTGDGRIIDDGAVTQAPFPQPLGWLQQEQHGDLSPGAVTVGTIEFADRAANGLIVGGGQIDDADPNGAEVVRRLEAGLAPGGTSWGISIDPDDYSLQIIDTQIDALQNQLVASISGSGSHRLADFRSQPGLAAQIRSMLSGMKSELVAAAGDPLPAEGEILYEDKADAILMRFNRLRQRGATLCAIPAFDEAKISLDGTGGEAAVAQPVAPPIGASGGMLSGSTITSSSTMTVVKTAPSFVPPGDWFENPGLEGPTRVTIGALDSSGLRHVFGHVATWGTCHKGYTDRCVPPPRGDDHGDFRQGRVMCDDGIEARTGVLTWGIPHADLTHDMIRAQTHYADSRHGWADVVSGEDKFGIWFSGAVRPNMTDADLYILRALSISGDWRWSVRDRKLKLIAALAVNYPGFPIAASSGSQSAIGPQLLFEGDRPAALVAAGVVDCDVPTAAEADLAYVLEELARLDRRTAHLRGSRAKSLVEQMLARKP